MPVYIFKIVSIFCFTYLDFDDRIQTLGNLIGYSL